MPKPTNQVFAPFCAALMGVDVVALIQLIGVPSLNQRLTLATVFFAVSLPLLALFMLNQIYESMCNVALEVWYQRWALGLGVTSSIGGISSLVAHLSLVAGAIFVLLCVIGIGLHVHFIRLGEKTLNQGSSD